MAAFYISAICYDATMRSARKYYVYIRIVIPLAALVIFMTTTNPQALPSVLLVMPFVLFFLTVYMTMLALFELSGMMHGRIFGSGLIRPRVVAGLVAGFPTLLLVLQSIGQLTPKDALTATGIFIVAYFYVAKLSVAPNR
jgi:hypothetical protein